MPTIHERIKERRTTLGQTLLEVANKLGVKEATVQRYESGEIKNIKHETVLKLAEIFECNPAYLMGWINDVNTPLPNLENQYVNEHERLLLNAYRKNTEMQPAVDRLLGIKKQPHIHNSQADMEISEELIIRADADAQYLDKSRNKTKTIDR